MKCITLAVLYTLIAFSEAVAVYWLTAVPLVLMSTHKPADAFFGIFRRRKSSPEPTLDIPQGPVQFPMSSFLPQRPSIFNPFGSFSGGFQNFPGSFQGNFKPQQPVRQTWSPAQQNPSRPVMMEQNVASESMDSDEQPPPINTEEAESFFTLLAETDENKCISRLVCEMGADPGSAGELGQTITEIIGSLTHFPHGSKVSEYNEVLLKGQSRGTSFCLSEYSACDEETYHLMKSNQPDSNEASSAAMLNMPS